MSALAKRLVADDHLAEDLAQEAALVAIEAQAPPSNPGPWLRGILRNLAANRRRRAARHAGVEALAARAEAVPSAAEAAAFVEQQRILSAAVLGLQPPFREVVLLRFYEELPQREISKRLQVPKATVNSRLTRALATLRDRLDTTHHGDRRAWVSALAPIALRGAGGGRLLLGFLIMKKTHVVAAAALVAVLVPATWILTGGAGSLTPPEPVVASPPVAANVPATASAPPTVEPPATTPAMPRTAVPASEATNGTLRIQVVDKSTGEPVTRADVRILDGMTMSATELEAFERVRREGLLRRAGVEDLYSMFPRHALDENGMLWLDRPAGQAGTVFARDRDRVGLLNLRAIKADTSTVLLELWPLNRVHVRVLDELDRPVPGVPVGIDHSGQLIRDTRAKDGVAELDWSFAYGPPRADLRQPDVFLAFPLLDAVRKQLPLATRSLQEIDLALPPAGRVRVNVTMGGKPAADGTLVHLTRRGTFMRIDPRGYSGPFIAETQGSVAEFWPVGVGTELEAYVLPGGQGYNAPGRRFFVAGPGPSSRDETVTMHLDVNARDVSIIGRVVAEGGTLVTDDFSGSVRIDGEDYPFHFNLELDNEGRFSLGFSLGTRERARIEISSRGRRKVEFPLPLANENGIIDLGDVHLTGSLRGMVVDPLGQPVTEGGRVWTGRPDTNSSTGWDYERAHELDSEGRFALADDEPGEDLWLHVNPRSELWYHEGVPWNREDSDIRLVLQPAGVIAARILLAPEVPTRRLDVVAWQPGGDAKRQDLPSYPFVASRVDAEGGIRFGSLTPGEYTFAVYLSGAFHLRPIVRFDGIEVAPGVVNEDPRLKLDLSDALRVIDLRVRDESGSAVEAMAIAYVNEARLVRDTWVFSSTDTPLVFPKADVLQWILVQAAGYFPATLTNVEDSQEVILSRGLPVSVRVHGAPPLEEPHSLVAVIEAPDAPVTRRRLWTRGPDSGDVDDQGHVGLRVRQAGEYRIRVGVKQDINNYVDYEDVTPSDAPTFRVADGDPSELDITIDAAAVHRAVQRLRDGR